MNTGNQEPLSGAEFQEIDSLVYSLEAAGQHDDRIRFRSGRRLQRGDGVGELQEAGDEYGEKGEQHEEAAAQHFAQQAAGLATARGPLQPFAPFGHPAPA